MPKKTKTDQPILESSATPETEEQTVLSSADTKGRLTPEGDAAGEQSSDGAVPAAGTETPPSEPRDEEARGLDDPVEPEIMPEEALEPSADYTVLAVPADPESQNPSSAALTEAALDELAFELPNDSAPLTDEQEGLPGQSQEAPVVEALLPDNGGELPTDADAADRPNRDADSPDTPPPQEVAEGKETAAGATSLVTAGEKAIVAKKRRGRKKKEPSEENLPTVHRGPTEIATAPDDFRKLNARKMDKGLSPEQLREWNALYASYRSKSLLRGTVAGVEGISFLVRDRETGLAETKTIVSLVVIDYRVKVLIPESEVWGEFLHYGGAICRAMVGATVDYIITNIDREGECAIASRSAALYKKRKAFERGRHEPGEILPCNLLVVGSRRAIAECGGYDTLMATQHLSWNYLTDLRTEFHTGQELHGKLISFDPREGRLKLSVREMNPNPLEGADRRNPVGCRRMGIIINKYKGAVFCRLNDQTVCYCLYSNLMLDEDFAIGDRVMIYIAKFDQERQLMYGRIATKI